jgi:hypothetical protein
MQATIEQRLLFLIGLLLKAILDSFWSIIILNINVKHKKAGRITNAVTILMLVINGIVIISNNMPHNETL